MRPQGSKIPPMLVDQLKSSTSDLTRMMRDHRHKLSPDLGQVHTQAIVFCTPKSNEGDNNNWSFIQMSLSREESEPESGFGDEQETEFSATQPQKSPSPPNTLTSLWCVEGMQDIYIEGVHRNERGTLAHSISEEPHIISSRLESVPSLQDTISRCGLQWLTKAPGKYSQTMVCEFYASYDAIVLNILLEGKKAPAQPRLTHIRVRG